MSDIAGYFDNIAHEFDGYYTGRRPSIIQEIGYRVFRGPGLKKRFCDTIKIVGDCRNQEILDVGCGPGVYTLYFAKNGVNVTAIDIAPKMIELAKLNLSNAGVKNYKVILGDFLKYEFTNLFDCTLAIGVFDYIEKGLRREYLDKLKRLARKKVIATFPKRFSPQAPIRRTMFFVKRQPLFFYTTKMITELAKECGLKAAFYNSGPIWTVEFQRYEYTNCNPGL